MAEDIQIGADTSQAVSAIGNIAKAFEEAARASGASSKAINASLKANERAVGGLLADMAKQQAASRASVQSSQAEVQANRSVARSWDEISAAQKRAHAQLGTKTNAAGQLISASTGQFASNSQFKAQLQHNLQVLDVETKIAQMRERASKQKMYNQLFAAPNPTGWQRFAGVLNSIPPASWANRIGAASAKIADMGNSARYALYDVSSSFGVAGAAIAAFGVLSVRAAVAHERAFANVERTTQTSAAGYEVLRRQLEQMSMSLPVTFEELTNIATAAGQLGISARGVSSFTSTVAKLSATTNLTSEAAGIALARFRAFFAEAESPELAVTERTFSNLASSILKVGVNSIASETGIVNVATQIASMGDYAGLTANQVVGLAGALSSIGVAPELARGTITRTFSLIGQAVSEGGEDLQKFADLAGVTSQEFHDAWGTQEFSAVFTQMIQGLHGVASGSQDANLMLMELGFNSVRDRPLLLRLASAANEAGEAGGLLAQTMADAYAGWVQNSELAIQYNKISKTTSARLQVLGQSFEQLAASMGQQTGGFLGEMAAQLTNVIRGFEEFSNSDAGQVLGSIAAQGALAVGGLLLLTAAGARTVASLQGIGFAFKMMSADGVGALTRLSGAFRVLSLSLGIVGIVGAIAGLAAGYATMTSAAEKANRGVQDTAGLLAAMRQDAEAGAGGITLYGETTAQAAAESRNAAAQAEGMTKALYGIKDGATQGASGMDALAASTEAARYVFGDAAEEFYKSQLLQSDAFQNLFDPTQVYTKYGELNKFFGQGLSLEQLGLDPTSLDWDQFMRDSINGGVDTDALANDLADQLGVALKDAEGNFTKEGSAIVDFSSQIGTIFGDIGGELQGDIGRMNALGEASQASLGDIVTFGADAASMMGELDEATQKAVDSMAQGFAKFTDTAKLIGLTQTLAAGDAEKFEQAWTDAYGGAAFSLSDFLTVQERAGEEQQTFIANLQNLSARGVSDGIISELSNMGPEANRLVQALVDGTDEQLDQYVENFGQTGYDASVAMAVQMQLGQEIVRNIMADGGTTALRAFNEKLASGVGVDAALTSLQRDVDGKPITVKPKTQTPSNLTWAQKRIWEQQNSLTVNARVRITGSTAIRTNPTTGGRSVVISNYAEGGHVRGPGSGTSDSIPANLSNGEFIMTAKATRNIGVGNLYNLMRQAQGGRIAPRRGNNYATGGMVGGGFVAAGNSGPIVVHLAAEDRALLRGLQPIVRIGDRDIAQAQAAANFRTTRQGV